MTSLRKVTAHAQLQADDLLPLRDGEAALIRVEQALAAAVPR
jgi:hypothetical protein